MFIFVLSVTCLLETRRRADGPPALASISNSLAELRNLYGTGHGKHENTKGLEPRHARLAVGAATTLTVFLFETFKRNDAKAILYKEI